jgi:hypothetical protein
MAPGVADPPQSRPDTGERSPRGGIHHECAVSPAAPAADPSTARGPAAVPEPGSAPALAWGADDPVPPERRQRHEECRGGKSAVSEEHHVTAWGIAAAACWHRAISRARIWPAHSALRTVCQASGMARP